MYINMITYEPLVTYTIINVYFVYIQLGWLTWIFQIFTIHYKEISMNTIITEWRDNGGVFLWGFLENLPDIF